MSDRPSLEDILIGKMYFPCEVSMEEPFARQMGNKSSHALKLQQHLHDQMMSQSDFCDVTLVVKNVEIKAHWNVLVSCPYFQSLYDSGLSEKRSGKIILEIGKLPAVRAAISFLYLGTVEVNYHNVKDLLEVGDYFQIADLKQCCQDYLYGVEITTDNCVHLCLLCSLYDLDLYNRAFEYLRGHLPEIMLKEDIMTLTSESVMSLLTDLTLCYVAQTDFYKFILDWVQHDPKAREKYFTDLFCTLNLQKVPRKMLEETIEINEFVRKYPKCQVHVLNTKMKYMAGLVKEDCGMRDVILLAGGCGQGMYFHHLFHAFPFTDSVSVNNIYGYIVEEERWTELAPLPHQMRKPILTYDSKGFLYVFDTCHVHDSAMFYIYKFRISDRTWTSFKLQVPSSCMNASMQNIIACNGKLYAIVSGRFEGKGPNPEWQTVILEAKEDGTESEISCFLFHRNLNTQVLSCAMSDAYICVLTWKHGSKIKKNRHLTKFYLYDTRTKRKIDRSKGCYWEPTMFPVGSDVVVCRMGKFSGKKFSFLERKWQAVKDEMLPLLPEDSGRIDYASLSDGKNYYLFGGKNPDTKKPLNSSFKYSFTDKKWQKLEDLPQPLMQSAACVVKLPSEQVKCHINCPHCSYTTRRSQALYNVEYPIDEDAYDEYSDFSMDDDDDYVSDPDPFEVYLDYEDYWY